MNKNLKMIGPHIYFFSCNIIFSYILKYMRLGSTTNIFQIIKIDIVVDIPPPEIKIYK